MFNLKASKSVEPYESLLSDNRKGKSLNGEVGNHEWMLKEVRKGSEGVTIEGQLKSSHEEKANVRVTEGQFEDHNPPEGYVRRDDGNDKALMKPLDALNAAQEAEKVAEYEKAKGVKGDAAFWDRYVATQLEGKKTTVPAQVPDDQLQNSYDRLKGLSVEDAGKHEKVRKMIMASMKDADAMLYYIYHKAALDGRELTKEENVLVDGITSDKLKLASLL
jgi:hypothetical protein